MNQQINIESLYTSLVGKFNIENRGSYEVIYPSGVEIKVFGNKYVKLVAVSRHKTSKHIVEVSVESSKGILPLGTTVFKTVVIDHSTISPNLHNDL